MTPMYETTPVFAITSDVDWASEDAIAIQQEIFDRHDVHATYFVTHASARLRALDAAGRVDLGVHPNFLAGSSHGNSFDEVITTVLGFAPDARSYRCHKYFDVSDVAHAFRARGFRYDANLCTNLQPGIAPIRHESGLTRFATYYEDGTHYWHRHAWRFSDFAEDFSSPGIKIISVHPMVTAMNVTTVEYWAELRQRFLRTEWVSLPEDVLRQSRCPEPGPVLFLEDMLAFVRRRGFPLLTLDELDQRFGVPAGHPR